MIDKIKIEKAVKELLIALGEDIDREGLIETPKRVANMYEEVLSGTTRDPREYLKFFNEENSEDTILIKDIPLYSICEHHMLPFFGRIHIAYIRKGNKVLGISKFARIVDCFARRLQVQERLTSQVADFIYNNVESYGVAVVAEAEHMCVTMRGVKTGGSKTKTMAFRGSLRDDTSKRQEILKLLEER